MALGTHRLYVRLEPGQRSGYLPNLRTPFLDEIVMLEVAADTIRPVASGVNVFQPNPKVQLVRGCPEVGDQSLVDWLLARTFY